MELVHPIELLFIIAQQPVMEGTGDCDINFVHSAVHLLVRRDYQINELHKQDESDAYYDDGSNVGWFNGHMFVYVLAQVGFEPTLDRF